MSEKWKRIVLSAKVFGHLSQGLYRTPAGAIKELISNSFDADARLVRIHTDFPRFTTFSCEDDGNGMSLDEFKRLVDRGIGNSFKRTGEEVATTALGRPFIGRLGLGILALAQICTQFNIRSHHKESKTAFEATIKFPPYTRQEMDKVAKRAAQTNEDVLGGEYTVREVLYDASKLGVRVFTKYLRESFRKVMSDLERFGNRTTEEEYEPYGTFAEFLEVIYAGPNPTQSLSRLSDYDELLFGLALAAPLPFVASRNVAVKLPLIADRQAALTEFDFEVHVDNLKLAHPVYLPADTHDHPASKCKLGTPRTLSFMLKDGPVKELCEVLQTKITIAGFDETMNLYEFEYDRMVAGRQLAFNGYLFQQTSRLFPRDIQGDLIRINNVAIGKYDNTILGYPLAEGPRYTMVSSEIFIEAGFEDALNIDRDSFNELHAHYIRVRAYLHGLLHERIFPVTWTEEKNRNKKRRTRESATHQTHFKKNYRAATGESLGRITRVESAPRDDAPEALRESSVDFGEREVQIDRGHPLLHALRRKTRYLPIVERLIIAFERALKEPNASRRRELFYRLVIDIFKDI